MKKILKKIFITIFPNKGQNTMNKDWANLNKYAIENSQINTNSKRIVFMGDSITESWKIINQDFFINNSYINRGISGQTTSQMVLRFRQDVIELMPSVVVILAGINDIAENTGPISIQDIMGNIKSMSELAKANTIGVILCSVLPSNRFYWNPKIDPAEKVIELNQLISNYATKNNITFVDYYGVMVDDTKGLPKKYSDDGVHPNLEGYKVMGDLVKIGIINFMSK